METLSYTKEVKAIKEHRCDFCSDKIRVGETYTTSTHKADGSIYDWKTHKHCSDIAHRLKMYEDCDEGLTTDGFQESIHNAHDDLLINLLPQDKRNEYIDVIQQLRYVQFNKKLWYVIRHYAKIDKQKN